MMGVEPTAFFYVATNKSLYVPMRSAIPSSLQGIYYATNAPSLFCTYVVYVLTTNAQRQQHS